MRMDKLLHLFATILKAETFIPEKILGSFSNSAQEFKILKIGLNQRVRHQKIHAPCKLPERGFKL